MNCEQIKYDFIRGKKRAKEMCMQSLLYVREDLNNAIKAQEGMHKAGYHTPKLGYYHDERHVICDEIRESEQSRIEDEKIEYSKPDYK